MSRMIELTVIRDDVCCVNADLLVLKHAAGFHGADATVANALTQHTDVSLEQIAKQVDTEGHFVVPTKQTIQASMVLFVKTPGLMQLYYPQIRDFASTALNVAAKCSLEPTHIAMTIHGPVWGLDASVAFLAQMTGLITAIATNSFPTTLRGISIVEKDPERTALLTMLLRYRFEREPYACRSSTGTVQLINVEQIQLSHQAGIVEAIST